MAETQYHIRKKKLQPHFYVNGDAIPDDRVAAINKFILDNNLKCYYKSHSKILVTSEGNLSWICKDPAFFTTPEDRNLFLMFFSDCFEVGNQYNPRKDRIRNGSWEEVL